MKEDEAWAIPSWHNKRCKSCFQNKAYQCCKEDGHDDFHFFALKWNKNSRMELTK